MQRYTTALRLLAFLSLSALIACGNNIVRGSGGQPLITYPPNGPEKVTINSDGSKVSIDFGAVPITQRREATLSVANVGNSDLTILKVTQDSADAEFSVDVAQGQVFVSGGTAVSIPVHFVPFTTGDKSAKVTLTTDSLFVPTIEISMSGSGIKLCVSLTPQQIDFGGVVVNTTATQSLAMSNCSGVDVSVTVGALKGTDPLLFASIPAAGTVLTLKDGETTTVTVQYTPLVASPTQNQAYFSMKLCSSGTGCEPLVSLRGIAVSTGLSVTPANLDFGFVPPGRAVVKFVTLANVANAPISLTADPVVQNIAAGGSTSAGAFQPGAGFPVKGTLIPPGGSIQVPIVFTPPLSDKFLGELDLSTDDASNSNVTVPLSGFGGGAVILCAPTSLDFGLNAVGINSTLSLLCTNVGQNVPGHPEANLFIPDPNSADQGLTVQNGDTAFQPAFDQPFPTGGLAAGQSVKINVTYAPTAAGADNDTLVISSNDSVTPRTLISLSGTAKQLADCDFVINPPNGLAFGHVEKGADAVLPFEVVNNGTDECLVNALQMSTGSSAAFSLPDYGNGGSVIIAAGESLEVQVRFAPTTQQASFAGTVAFTISNKARQHQAVHVTGSSLSGCLLILPSPVDFGVVGFDLTSGHWCKSSKRSVTIRNICDNADVNVTSISVVDLAAQPEFILTGDPSPVTVPKTCSYCAPSAPVTFQVSFEPNQQGKHNGGVKIATSDLVDPYLVALSGDAETNTVQTDNFTGHKAAIDILWVMDTDDDSDAHQSIIANLSNFMNYPLQNNIDFHMASTSTDVYAGTSSEQGRIEPCPGCKIAGSVPTVVSASEGLDAVGSLARILNLGSGYGCFGVNCRGFASDEMFFEAAYEALSPDLIKGYNRPWYRPDAFLAVITVNGDPEDDRSDVHPLNFYYNAFVGLKGARNAYKFSYSYVNRAGGIANNSQKVGQMTQLTGGVEADLSNTGTPNWTDELNALWPQVATLLLEYPLSGTPVTNPMSIEVIVNGVRIPQLSNGFPQWTYDPKNNAVQFDPLAFPQPGDAVQITYTIACNG